MEPKNRASLGSLSDAWALGEFALDVHEEDEALSLVQPPAIEKDPPGRAARARLSEGARPSRGMLPTRSLGCQSDDEVEAWSTTAR